MTTQEYIDAEVHAERNRIMQKMALTQHAQAIGNSLQMMQAYLNPGPPGSILLRAKVRELTDKLIEERSRCAKIARDAKEGWKAYPEGGICDEIAGRIENDE